MKSLWEIALKEKITVVYKRLLPDLEHFHGLYYRDPYLGPIIVLDIDLRKTPRLHRCILAEEIGHHFTLTSDQALIPHTSFSYSRAISMTKAEELALRWACDYLMPVYLFLDAVRSGLKTIGDLADLFNVTEWMVCRRVEFIMIRQPKLLQI